MNSYKFNGILNINKEMDMTSHDVVSIVRKILNMKRVGHTGTLDPQATGVLPICLGKSTRVSDYVMNGGKTYEASMLFGYTTNTLDIWGQTLEKKDFIPSKEKIIEVFNSFSNKEIKQIPPMFSAIKVNGKKLYELARNGIEIERKERKI